MANNHDISIRVLDAGDLEELRAMRIRALRLHPGLFGESVEVTEERPNNYWQETLDNKGKCVFGLCNGTSIIGFTAVFTWSGDSSKKTGIMAMSFIEPKYRGRGYSSYLYKARIDFAIKFEQWTKLHVSHREGNLASRAAIIKHGFQYVSSEEMDFPDQTRDFEHNYELNLCALRSKNQ